MQTVDKITVSELQDPGYAINREEWVKRSLFDQLGNIGSEVGRTQFAMAARMKRQV